MQLHDLRLDVRMTQWLCPMYRFTTGYIMKIVTSASVTMATPTAFSPTETLATRCARGLVSPLTLESLISVWL